jgi:hypothetical protein
MLLATVEALNAQSHRHPFVVLRRGWRVQRNGWGNRACPTVWSGRDSARIYRACDDEPDDHGPFSGGCSGLAPGTLDRRPKTATTHLLYHRSSIYRSLGARRGTNQWLNRNLRTQFRRRALERSGATNVGRMDCGFPAHLLSAMKEQVEFGFEGLVRNADRRITNWPTTRTAPYTSSIAPSLGH